MSEEARLCEAFELWHATGRIELVRERFADVMVELEKLISVSEFVRALPDASADLPPADFQIPGFRVLRARGRGATGVVYEAIQETLDRRVALKILTGARLNDTTTRKRFRREALAVARLDHPSIVRVYASGDEDGIPWMAMELVDSEPLSRRIAATRTGEPGALPTDVAARCRFLASSAAPLARALASAHACGIVHRDVKPSNVIIAADGSAKLLDFGLATLPAADGLTLSGHPIGTPVTMSPEQARGASHAVGPASDVYGLGATLYEAALLRSAFGNDGDLYRTLAAVGAGQFDAPRRINPAVPREFEAILLKAMALDPRDRYRDAAAMAVDLDAFAAGLPVQARRPSFGARGKAWMRRNSRRAVVACACGILATMFIVSRLDLFSANLERRETAARLQAAAREVERMALHEQIRRLLYGIAQVSMTDGAGDQETDATIERVGELCAGIPDDGQAQAQYSIVLLALHRDDEARKVLAARPSVFETAEGHLVAASLAYASPDESVHRSAAERIGIRSCMALFCQAMLESRHAPRSAVALLRRALQAPDMAPELAPVLHQEIGLLQVALAEYAEADEHLIAVAAMTHNARASLAVRATVLERLNREADAQALFARVMDELKRSGSLSHRIRVATVLKNAGDCARARRVLEDPPPSGSHRALWFEAFLNIIGCALAEPTEADFDLVRASGREFPDDSRLQYLVGRAHLNPYHTDSRIALTHLERAVELDPKNVMYRLQLVTAVATSGDRETALDMLARVRGEGCDRLEALGVECLIHRTYGEWDEMAKASREIIESRPDDALAHLYLAEAAQKLGDTDAARGYGETAARLAPRNQLIARSVASRYLAMGDSESALRAIDCWLAANPPSLLFVETRAKILEDLHRGDEAVAERRRAVLLQPGNAEPYFELGRTLSMFGREAEALEAARDGARRAVGENVPRSIAALTALARAGTNADRALVREAGHRLASRPEALGANRRRLVELFDAAGDSDAAGAVEDGETIPAASRPAPSSPETD